MTDPHWLAYVPLGMLVVVILGGIYAGMKLTFLLGRHFASLDSKVETLEKQFKPNGGSSMKDDINKLKGDLRDVNTKLDTYFAVTNVTVPQPPHGA